MEYLAVHDASIGALKKNRFATQCDAGFALSSLVTFAAYFLAASIISGVVVAIEAFEKNK